MNPSSFPRTMPESPPTRRRWPKILGISLCLFLLIAVAAFLIAVRALKGEIIAALGPGAEVRELKIGLTQAQIIGIRLPAPRAESGWPAEDFLRAERVIVTPSLASLLRGRIVLDNIRVEGAYLSLLRARDGRLRLIPTLTEGFVAKTARPPARARFAALRRPPFPKPCAVAPAAPPIAIGRLEIVESRLDFFDASLHGAPLKITLENLNLSLEHLRLPGLTGESRLELTGVIKGKQQDGNISIAGQIEFASKASNLKTRLQSVDLTGLQAYLVKAGDADIQRGLLDMEIHSVVKNGQLRAPGMLTLRHLELGDKSNIFMGLSRDLVIAVLQGGKDQISVRFTLAGDLNHPAFSLNESLARSIGVGLMSALGLNVKKLIQGLGNTGGDMGKLGESLGKILGGQQP
jgi:hypothetical protein